MREVGRERIVALLGQMESQKRELEKNEEVPRLKVELRSTH